MRAGFSLIEVLVALALFALLGAAGAAVLITGVDNREVIGAASERLGRLQRLEAVLRADLGQAADRTVREADGRARPYAFVGGGGDGVLFDFVRDGRANPGGAPRAALERLEYRLTGGRLERRAYPHPDGTRPDPPLVLHDGVRAARVAYLSQGRTGDDWTGSAARPLPDAVRLELDLDDYGPVTLTLLVRAP